jgi:hypothetical protein
MAQFFGTEDIKDLTKASQTTIDWAAGSYLKIAGQAYNVTSVLTLDLATDIDTGSVSSDTIYYIYAVVIAGTVSLKYSLSDSAPTGFTAYRKIGAFGTDGSAEVVGTSVQDYGSVGDVIQSMLTEEKFIQENGAGWVLANGRNVAGSKYATLIGASIPDLRGQFLRGKNNGRSDGQENPDGDVALGTPQTDELRSHTHTFFKHNIQGGGAGPAVNQGGSNINTSATGGAETRPKNVTVNFFIKIEDIAI